MLHDWRFCVCDLNSRMGGVMCTEDYTAEWSLGVYGSVFFFVSVTFCSKLQFSTNGIFVFILLSFQKTPCRVRQRGARGQMCLSNTFSAMKSPQLLLCLISRITWAKLICLLFFFFFFLRTCIVCSQANMFHFPYPLKQTCLSHREH